MQTIDFKPNKTSFFVIKMTLLFISLFIIFIFPTIIYIINVGFNVFIFPFFVVFFIIFSVFYFLYSIVFKKELYTFYQNKIIYKNGTIFSDNLVEIEINKITEVSMVLPFLENLFFKTGKIIIKTAGSSTSKIVLQHQKEPEKLFSGIQKLMRENGFHLKKDKIVQEARPHILGVLFELFTKISGVFIFIFYFFIDFIFGDTDISDFQELGEIEKFVDFDYYFLFNYGILILVLIVLFVFGILVLNYLELKRRKYIVFTDSIFYTNGFLTKVFSFLPMEKVTDIDNHQGFFSKIFGIHDIIVSSEGANNNVVFSNMIDGEILIKNIKYLKNSITLTKTEIENSEEKQDELVGFVDKTDFVVNYDRELQKKYKVDVVRTAFGGIFYGLLVAIFIFFIIGEISFIVPILALSIIYGIVKSLIYAHFTKYILDKNTVEYKYDFMSNRQTTFTVDKVTGVIFSESIIDKIFKTCSVTFYSIGSSSNIYFKNIKKTETLEKEILSKVGIFKNNDFESLKVDFSFKNYILKNIYSIIFIIPIFGYFYSKIFYSSRFYSQKIYSNFYESISGIFVQVKSYSLFKNIKGVTSLKYPITNTGRIILDIAGDILIDGKNNVKISTGGMYIFGDYLENIYSLQDKINTILNGKELEKEILFESKQSIGNTIIAWLFIFIITLPIFIIYIWFIKTRFYRIEKDMIVFGEGIIFKSRKNILLEKINIVEKKQGFLGKIFKNGNVYISTVGTSSIDMSFIDTVDYEELYNILKK